MPRKKKKSGLLPLRKRTISAAALVVLITVVGYLVVTGNTSKTGASLTAPMGTVARSDEISATELNQEKALDAEYDTQHQSNVHDDASMLEQVGEAVRDE